MVKLTEVEDEHFAQEKPQSSKNNVLLASDDEEDEDYTDTESEISEDSDVEVDAESFYDRMSALKDIIPPSARRSVNSTVSSITSFTKSSLMFSGKALWILSTSAFLVGIPFALAYAEEEQYVQMEREQGMIKGANEVRFDLIFNQLCVFPSPKYAMPAVSHFTISFAPASRAIENSFIGVQSAKEAGISGFFGFLLLTLGI
ncbi:mitochondrial import receptor subunit Tom22-domain-containing protein [Aspergillus avenaceus]|uniref:Mitochondrial import receptor subunit Tom22-domain-containing protein n=1 Tax=Aspergillus avenaceus TaxID=36643 RepID=A0A5N6TGR6_ASPAV|nr:mitochondrial import receptor subunit Tom22-domain-containing protein [Aspergillus avenaceus]